MNLSIKGKTILITGGTGSFGKKFVDRILQLKPKKVIIFSRCELKQYEMAREVNDERVRFLLGDVRDRKRLDRAFTDVNYVIHAAALKQIPAAEYNPYECIKTNVLGAQNVIEAAIDAGVEKVVALSTDKAVSPINLYGAAKLCAEKLFTTGNAYSTRTRFSCVRYGNVIGSRGSVIPLFKKQAATGRLTITDERMSRFLITLDQAVDLVLLALSNMNGGEIFVPRIPSAMMVDIARLMGAGCEIQVTGIRPGEKLNEAMITEEDSRRTVAFGEYFIIEPETPDNGKTYWGSSTRKANVPEGFVYASNTNDWWLTDEQLIKLIDEVK